MARYRGRHVAAEFRAEVGRGRGGIGIAGGKLRKGVTTTAIAAAAMAALTASQAPGVELGHRGGDDAGKDRTDAAQRDDASGDDSYHTELPPLESPAPPKSSPDGPGSSVSEAGIPASVLAAYKKAERSLAGSAPGCGLRWELLAAIGKVESGQARGGAVDKSGTTLKPILGPVLNGSGFARINDTDAGQFDGDARFDRAVGPLQFIPSTWSRWGTDGNGDGRSDPNNVYDAALAAGKYLCAGERELTGKAGLDRAILSYNDSRAYLRTVLAWYEYYRKGTHQIPDGAGPLPTSPGAGGAADKPGKGAHHHGGAGAHKPGKGNGNSNEGRNGNGNGGGSHGTPTPSPSPTAPAHLQRVGESGFSAPMGGNFAAPPRVRVTDRSGTPVKGARVQYKIVGTTGARFAGLLSQVTVPTDGKGVAVSSALNAGIQRGHFTVRATVVGHDVPPVDFKATVSPAADLLARTSFEPLTAATNAAFAHRIELKATFQGKPVADVPLTATMVTDDAKPVENDKGPYFKDADGKTVRTLTGLKAGKDGTLELPEIFTDEHDGPFTLRLTTAEGTKLDIALTVTKA